MTVIREPLGGNLLVERMAGFVGWLRGHGFKIGVAESLDALRVAEYCTLQDSQRLRWGLKSLLCGHGEEWRRFDRLFEAYWLPATRNASAVSSNAVRLGGLDSSFGNGRQGGASETDRPQAGDDSDAAPGGARGGASARETTATTDFRFLADARQMEAMERMAERLARRMRRRLIRRRHLVRQGRRLHLRRTIRQSLAYGGTPLERIFKRRRRRLPRLVLLLDVSRSMSLYSYLFLRFARGLLGAFQDAQAFVYHTRLIPVSEVLREPDMERLKEKLSLLALGWAGGTRIGESLQAFNRQYARQSLNSRSVVVIMSDGFDTGPPQVLAEELRQIRRRARKIVWLNPLLGREGYQPLAGGMQAALPFIDVFASAHSLESLAALEAQLVSL